ncbi:MAG: hypothetical protein ACTTJ6_01690 [Treponema sp.]
MTNQKWKKLNEIKNSLKSYCIESLHHFEEEYSPPALPLTNSKSFLKTHIKNILNINISYDIETPIVYNHSLDLIEEKDEIHLILVGDNPGKEEQKHINQRYLVGQSGRIAEGFFTRHKELKIDFRKNVIILNKSVLHTPKTLNLKTLIKEDKNIESFLIKDQVWQARLALNLQETFNCPLWIIGYSELGEKGIFSIYAKTLKNEIKDTALSKLFLYQHFSMNCFIKQLKANYDQTLSLEENLKVLGINNRKKIFMF